MMVGAAVTIRVLAMFGASGLAFGQQATPPMPAQPPKLAFLIPGFIDDSARVAVAALPGSDPAFQGAVRSIVERSTSLGSLNASIATQLSNLPVYSPASATRYEFDPQLRVYVPFRQSLGPVLTERAETIGKERFFFAFTWQRFQFDRQDDLDWRNLAVVIPLDVQVSPLSPVPLRFRIDSQSFVSLNISQATAYFTYGVTHWLDASYVIPVVTSTLLIQTNASLTAPNGAILPVLPTRSVEGSSTGIGDQTARIKAHLFDRKHFSLALATDFRLPTGDEFNFHGAGAFGVKPFLIASFTAKSISPHINAGYQWNGSSLLASRSGTEKQRLPGQIWAAAGLDAAMSPRLTLAFDVLDQVVINGQRAFLERSTGPDNTQYVVPVFPAQSRHELSAAAGFKADLGSDLVFTGNVLLRLNNAGLRARVVPLLGISYLF